MVKKIYGVDPDEGITPLKVRDAIIECFFEAHCEDTGLTISPKEKAGRLYCEEIVKKAFKKTGGDFNKPTKQSIMAAMDELAEFSKNFRNPEIVKKHYGEIMVLVNKLPDEN